MRKRHLIALIALAVAGWFFLWQSAPAPETPGAAPPHAEPAYEKEPEAEEPRRDFVEKDPDVPAMEIPPRAQAEIQKCIGRKVGTLRELKDVMAGSGGPVKADSLDWRNIHFQDANKKYRLRLALEPSKSGKPYQALSLFEVDEEDLPEPMEIPEEHRRNPSREIVLSYLKNRTVTTEQEAHSMTFVNGGELRYEEENGRLTLLEAEIPNLRLFCDSRSDTECKCFQPLSR